MVDAHPTIAKSASTQSTIPQSIAGQAITGQSRAGDSVAQRESMLRRIAVVLSSLPAPTAAKLLSTVNAQSRQMIHQVVATLPPVDGDERAQVIRSFATRIQSDVSARIMSTVSHPSGVQDEIVIGQPTTNIDHHDSAHLRSSGQLGSLESAPAAASHTHPFAFLDHASTESLVELLQGEHPQTIALVLASVSPKQAAEVLPKLEQQIQSETLSRIGRLDDVHDETVADLADHLRNRLAEQTQAESISSGKRALQAIMSQLPNLAAHTRPVDTAQQLQNQTEAHELRIDPRTLPGDSFNQQSELQADLGKAFTDGPALSIHDPDNRIADNDRREFQQTDADHQSFKRSGLQQIGIEQTGDSTDKQKWQSYLVEIPPEQLVTALGQVSTRSAFLTLCGLPNTTSERAIAKLPRAKAKTVRKAMAQLSDLQLHEIDNAIRDVAQAAYSNRLQPNQTGCLATRLAGKLFTESKSFYLPAHHGHCI